MALLKAVKACLRCMCSRPCRRLASKAAILFRATRAACLQVFEDLDFTLMEMNPFTLDHEGSPFPLDMRGELDDTAAFKSLKKWGDVEFPLPFGRTMTAAEEYVHTLDGNTGPPAPPFQASTPWGSPPIWPIACLACTPLRRQSAMRLHPMECSDHADRV